MNDKSPRDSDASSDATNPSKSNTLTKERWIDKYFGTLLALGLWFGASAAILLGLHYNPDVDWSAATRIWVSVVSGGILTLVLLKGPSFY